MISTQHWSFLIKNFSACACGETMGHKDVFMVYDKNKRIKEKILEKHIAPLGGLHKSYDKPLGTSFVGIRI